jgi:hypothetical protein
LAPSSYSLYLQAFNHLNSEFEITLESGSIVERCSPEDPNVGRIKAINYEVRPQQPWRYLYLRLYLL